MRSSFGIWIAAAAASLAMNPPIRIVAPAAFETRTWMPLTIEIQFDENADAQTLLVELNGDDITDLFSLSAAAGGHVTAIAFDVWDDRVLLGANQIDASIDLSGAPENAARAFETQGDPYADGVEAFVPGANGGFNAGALPDVVLGSPVGSGLFVGGLDVVSLGRSGRIDLRFDDNVIVDGPGVDFTVFENAFLEIGAGNLTTVPFAEPGRVSVSQDGIEWFAFPCALSPGAGPYWPGCAGVYPVLSNGTLAMPHASIPSSDPIASLVGQSVFTIQAPAGSGGDSYDLAAVGLAWARYVRIEAADFDTNVVGSGNSGFDIDAVAAVNSAPSIPLPSLGPGASNGLAIAVVAVAARALRRTRRRR